MPNEIPAVFDDGLNYDYHFIIKELSNEFEFECLEENTKNYQTFFVPLEIEVTKINKDGNESVVTISYTIKFINNAKVMASPLSHLVDNLAEGIHQITCKT